MALRGAAVEADLASGSRVFDVGAPLADAGRHGIEGGIAAGQGVGRARVEGGWAGSAGRSKMLPIVPCP